MKLKTAFKLSALAVALASTSAMAATLDTSELGNDVWTDPRGAELGNIDKSAYQYVDVGTGVESQTSPGNPQQNNLTSWYTLVDKDGKVVQEIIKIETPAGNDKTYQFYDVTGSISREAWLTGNKQFLDNLTLANSVPDFLSGIDVLGYYDILKILTVPEEELKSKDNYTDAQIQAVKAAYSAGKAIGSNGITDRDVLESGLLPTNLGGVTGIKKDTENTVSTIKRLDSTYLEYAELAKENVKQTTDFGNLTDKDVTNPQVWLTISTPVSTETETTYDRGVINGIINTDKKGHLNDSNKYVKHFTNLFDKNATVTDNVYGLVASEVKTVTTKDSTGTSSNVVIDRYTALTQAGVVVSDEIAKKQTVITSEGITTGKLTVGGVDVGTALGNAAALGNLSKDQLEAIVTGGEKISALETGLSGLDTKVTTEVARLDGRIDAELKANAAASTAYTDEKAAETLAAAKAEDAKTLTAAQAFAKAEDIKTLADADKAAKAEDVKTLASAKSYTDTQVAGFNTQITNVNTRVDQLNKRVNDVEEVANRGVAIALAAQQQIPNIAAGQVAVFGGVGHYEGETAAALGLATVFGDGRTSLSAAVGVAGGSEVGGRVGVAYVFGGK